MYIELNCIKCIGAGSHVLISNSAYICATMLKAYAHIVRVLLINTLV